MMRPVKPIKIVAVPQQPTITTEEFIKLWARLIKAGEAERLDDEQPVGVNSAVPEREPEEKAS